MIYLNIRIVVTNANIKLHHNGMIDKYFINLWNIHIYLQGKNISMESFIMSFLSKHNKVLMYPHLYFKLIRQRREKFQMKKHSFYPTPFHTVINFELFNCLLFSDATKWKKPHLQLYLGAEIFLFPFFLTSLQITLRKTFLCNWKHRLHFESWIR